MGGINGLNEQVLAVLIFVNLMEKSVEGKWTISCLSVMLGCGAVVG